MKGKLDWAITTGSARKWWEAFENENQHHIALVLRLAEELAVRKVTITEFFLAYYYSNTDSVLANLSYLDYVRLKKVAALKKTEVAQKEKEGRPAEDVSAFGFLPLGFDTSFGITNTKGWSDEQVQAKLEEVMGKLDWANTTGSARKWWETFRNTNTRRAALVLRLAEELAIRKVTITEFFGAYASSNTDNVQANLFYLDYFRLKKEEERKRRGAAEAEGPKIGDLDFGAPDFRV